MTKYLLFDFVLNIQFCNINVCTFGHNILKTLRVHLLYYVRKILFLSFAKIEKKTTLVSIKIRGACFIYLFINHSSIN